MDWYYTLNGSLKMVNLSHESHTCLQLYTKIKIKKNTMPVHAKEDDHGKISQEFLS